MELLNVKNLNKIYRQKHQEIHALKDVNLTVKKGEFVAITGESGSGKSTLLHIIAGFTK